MPRLFFALWPNDAVRREIAHAQAALPRLAGRRVPVANLHLTLAFLGQVSEARTVQARAVAAGVEAPPFLLHLELVEWRRRTGIVWLAARATPPGLAVLDAALRAGLAEAGFPSEARPLHPHLTLARDAPHPPGPGSGPGAGPGKGKGPVAVECPPLPWPVDDFVLVESQTGGAASTYQILGRWPLRAPAPEGGTYG
jgi:2'-5' RNA ligase